MTLESFYYEIHIWTWRLRVINYGCVCYIFFWLLLVEPLPLSEIAMRHNAALLEYCRTSISALSGSTAGILGLTGLYGFIFYFVVAFLMSVSKSFPPHCCFFAVWIDFLNSFTGFFSNKMCCNRSSLRPDWMFVHWIQHLAWWQYLIYSSFWLCS